LSGLDSVLQHYPFEEWSLTGRDLLLLSYKDLEKLGVKKIGHQELVLEAVEKLCSLNYDMMGESMRSLTEKLRTIAHSLPVSIQSRWRVHPYTGQSESQLPSETLLSVINVITAARGLFCWINRYLFSQLHDYTATKDIITYCGELGQSVHKDISAFEKEKDIISSCRKIVAICDEILISSPPTLLNHTATLESVDLVPASPGETLGIEITSTDSILHYVTGTASESPAGFSEKILAGDEVIQVNDQVVVGWSRKSLVKKLQENPNGVTLVLKKVPVCIANQERPQKPLSSAKEPEAPEPFSILQRVAASVRSLSFNSHPNHKGELQSKEGIPQLNRAERTELDRALSQVSPEAPQTEVSSAELQLRQASRLSVTSRSSCPEMAGQSVSEDEEFLESELFYSAKLSTRTGMSRRRVSCRELGRADCDGWLWKKKKDSGVFVAQKWQRFWFVLKGPNLYWYNSQQEEKAEGLIQVSTYRIEGAGEHKRKYVFQVCHERFQTFFFAADNVNDMSKWINCLIMAIQKYKNEKKNQPHREEDCYSETEPEDEGSNSPQASRHKKSTASRAVNTLPRIKGKEKKRKEIKLSSGTAPLVAEKKPGAPEDEMGVLFNRLKEGGVSLLGNEQPMTRDHFRRSFIKRNKNPIINEKALTLRALQSTLKAKEAELQTINKLLDNPELTSTKFREWKERNEELCQEIDKLTKAKAMAKGAGGRPGDEREESGGSLLDKDRQSAALSPGEGDPSRDSVFSLRLSQGEQLVDMDPTD
ncbi:CNKR1 kinase, partial [Amia calva]|nr:CNKR1 kinase [Amia calva]